ncbi:MAG: sensor histidine kinase [Acidothermus sp.]|nr:sensor histidine kinase [Acidothermus sp.]
MTASARPWPFLRPWQASQDGPAGARRRWRRAGGIWLFYLVGPLVTAWRSEDLGVAFAGTVALLAFAWVYLFACPWVWFAGRTGNSVGSRGRGQEAAVTGLLFVLSLVSIAVIGPTALTTWVFVAVTWMLLFPIRIGAPLTAALVALALVAPQYVPGWHVRGVQWSMGASIAFASVAVFAFVQLLRTTRQLAAARAEVAQLAAEQERARIARDLHDLLGHSLTTITVKAGLAARLADRDPDRARTEIAEVEELARRTLADVRAAVAGYREARLATELAAAREVLAAAGIDADLPRVVDEVPTELAALFGWVVREGVTNVVRHSRATRVRIRLEPRAIEIVDDGIGPPDPDLPASAGHGLAGLAERVAAAGGRLLTGAAEGFAATAGFRLRVEVP